MITAMQYARDMWLAGLEPSQIAGNLAKFPNVTAGYVADVLLRLDYLDRATHEDFNPADYIRRPHA